MRVFEVKDKVYYIQGEKDSEYSSEDMTSSVMPFYKLHRLHFRTQIEVEPLSEHKCLTEEQRKLYRLIYPLSQINIIIPVETLMINLGIQNPFALVTTLDNLVDLGIVSGFEHPQIPKFN